MRRTRMLAISLAIVTTLAAAACGDTNDGDVAADEGGAAGATQEAGATAATVALADTPLGNVLVDAEGMTLYLFKQDQPGKSNCAGGCAQMWPPVTVDGEARAGDGVSATDLTTVARDDGSTQVAYHGMPLYRYAKDTKSGDTNGHGVGGVWFVVGADGKAVAKTATTTPGISY
jgi:predicted lipoprotein with Yx(FWY)xxD motif